MSFKRFLLSEVCNWIIIFILAIIFFFAVFIPSYKEYLNKDGANCVSGRITGMIFKSSEEEYSVIIDTEIGPQTFPISRREYLELNIGDEYFVPQVH